MLTENEKIIPGRQQSNEKSQGDFTDHLFVSELSDETNVAQFVWANATDSDDYNNTLTFFWANNVQ